MAKSFQSQAKSRCYCHQTGQCHPQFGMLSFLYTVTYWIFPTRFLLFAFPVYVLTLNIHKMCLTICFTWFMYISILLEFWVFFFPLPMLYLETRINFPHSSLDKESACSVGDLGLIPGLGRSPRKGNGNPLQYSCLENSMDRGAWWATVHGVAKSQTWLSDLHFHFLSPLLHLIQDERQWREWSLLSKLLS